MVGVAAVYFSVLKCLEACVGSIVSFQFAVGFVLRLIVFDQPDVGISSPVEYRFESQRYRSAVGQGSKDIVGSGVLIEATHSAVSSRNVPCRAVFHFADHRRPFEVLRFYLLCEGQIFLLDAGKQRVSLRFLSK